MIRLADYVAQFLVNIGVKDIFMLTGYGSMYLNDAIEISGIKHYATRNEASAPMMAAAYARLNQSIGAVCVTAGPGATNAVPGLAEAWVDAAPIIILSGQVERAHTTYNANLPGLRSFGVAEINIIPVVKSLTKFAEVVNDPNKICYQLEKAFYLATHGRPGPVWLDIPLDVQQAIIDPEKLDGFEEPVKIQHIELGSLMSLLESSSAPIVICGNGVRQSGSIEKVKQLLEYLQVPVLLSRFGNDLFPHSYNNVFGHAGTKGSKFCKRIMQKADLVLSLGCRLAVPLVGQKFEAFSENCKVVMVDIEKDELKKPGIPIYLPIHADLKYFLHGFMDILKRANLPNWDAWLDWCTDLQNDNLIDPPHKNPIDLYHFMSQLDILSNENHVFVTDAGSNYYSGGQVWHFEKGQREIASVNNAAMGTTIPLAIGCAVANPKAQILAVTGDGSIELNIQELKTISHYGFNIKLFVINNGGYASMKKWQDSFFEGRRIDTEDATGVGTLDFSKISDAFGLEWILIDKHENIDSTLEEVMSYEKPQLIEVVTDPNQKIIEAFIDY